MKSTSTPQPIELLAPAKNAECGIEAIRHGADAVYIGGPGFGARAAAGNSIEDIARLCDFAHTFGARIYVTFNTILWNDELATAERMVWDLYRAGVDALIVQDLSLLQMKLPPIALHASTQMDNCTVEKAQWLEAAGFRQIVLARETTLDDTRRIAQAVKVPLEAFVHGALCVSYSGRCYASQYCFGRSANRGCCAQFCRLAFDLVDADGRIIVADRHLLSLRDMNRTSSLEEMMDAGVRSFKIEGRLKDVSYVKNVTAWYRQEIDKIIRRRPETYRRASFGTSQLTFIPDATRSFNRGFTNYFLHGRTAAPVHSFATPKAVGPVVGQVQRVRRQSFTLIPSDHLSAPIVGGDGLCFVGADGKLQGFRVNKAEGHEIFPNRMPRLPLGVTLHRSLDFAFDKTLAKPTAKRTLALDIAFREVPSGYALDMADETGCHVSLFFEYEHTVAQTSQREAVIRQLSKLGDTCFVARQVEVQTVGDRFVPASVLAGWRRETVDALLRTHRASYQPDRAVRPDDEKLRKLLPPSLDFTANVSNRLAEAFYSNHGVRAIEQAFELNQPKGRNVIMTCKHCIRHALNICKKNDRSVPDPLYLRLPDGRKFPLRFDCARCEMQVLTE